MARSGPPHPDSLNAALNRSIDALQRRHGAEIRMSGFHERMSLLAEHEATSPHSADLGDS